MATIQDRNNPSRKAAVTADGEIRVTMGASPSINIGDVSLVDANENPITVQNPLPTDGDSVYAKDIDVANSSIGDFSGSITDLFDSRTSTITTSADNPTFTIALLRPVHNHSITLVTSSGDFSNVTIVAKDASGTVLETIDDSSNSAKYTAHGYNFTDIDKWCVAVITFSTTDDVTLSFLGIDKSVHTVAHIHAERPDGTIGSIDATAGGNLKISLEEFEPGAFNTTPLPVFSAEAALTTLLRDNSGDSNIFYVGKAPSGTVASAAAWQIKRVDETNGIDGEFADADNEFDNVWNNRESLSYS